MGGKKVFLILKFLSEAVILELQSENHNILFDGGSCLHLKIPWNAVVSVIGLVMIEFGSQRAVLHRNAKEIVTAPF